MAKIIEQGIQKSSKKVIEYGIRSGGDTGHDRRPNPDDTTAQYITKKASPVSGNAATQIKGIKNQKGSSAFIPKGKVSSFGGGEIAGKQSKGFGGQTKSRG